MKRYSSGWLFVFLIGAIMLGGGCAVPQSPGKGNNFILKEPTSKRSYYLYLPAGFNHKRQWPLVVSLHGMKPFDGASAQMKEWQSAADKYRMVVVAPVLMNSALFMEYPLNHVDGSVRVDEQSVIEILNDVIKNCNINPKQIYATSWSSGGYLMHYIVNHNPDVFAALCARGSCFNEKILNTTNAKVMGARKFPVMIYYGANDLPGICSESRRAIRWYEEMGFPVSQAVIPHKGHERVVDLAAKFFVQSGEIGQNQQKVEIKASELHGEAPFTLSLQANMPGIRHEQYQNYTFSWYIDGLHFDQTDGLNKYVLMTTISTLGEHTIRVNVLTPEKHLISASTKINVLPPNSKSK